MLFKLLVRFAYERWFHVYGSLCSRNWLRVTIVCSSAAIFALAIFRTVGAIIRATGTTFRSSAAYSTFRSLHLSPAHHRGDRGYVEQQKHHA